MANSPLWIEHGEYNHAHTVDVITCVRPAAHIQNKPWVLWERRSWEEEVYGGGKNIREDNWGEYDTLYTCAELSKIKIIKLKHTRARNNLLINFPLIIFEQYFHLLRKYFTMKNSHIRKNSYFATRSSLPDEYNNYLFNIWNLCCKLLD